MKRRPEPKLKRGRPRTFDPDEALDRALQVFWRKGYQGASMSDLTAAMRISRPSVYAAFGNKAALFRKVLVRYDDGPAGFVRKALDEPSSRAVAERLLRGAAEMQTGPLGPRGCLMVQGALAGGASASLIRRELNDRRAAAETAVRKRLERARAEGDLPANSSPADLARYLVTVFRGMAVEAAGGASRSQLLRVVQTALSVWPS